MSRNVFKRKKHWRCFDWLVYISLQFYLVQNFVPLFPPPPNDSDPELSEVLDRVQSFFSLIQSILFSVLNCWTDPRAPHFTVVTMLGPMLISVTRRSFWRKQLVVAKKFVLLNVLTDIALVLQRRCVCRLLYADSLQRLISHSSVVTVLDCCNFSLLRFWGLGKPNIHS